MVAVIVMCIDCSVWELWQLCSVLRLRVFCVDAVIVQCRHCDCPMYVETMDGQCGDRMTVQYRYCGCPVLSLIVQCPDCVSSLSSLTSVQTVCHCPVARLCVIIVIIVQCLDCVSSLSSLSSVQTVCHHCH